MPTYEYKCSSCNHSFEYFQSMTAEPLKVCPECGGSLKRVIGTGAGTIFKGSGFYQTDYKNKSSRPKSSDKTEKPDTSSVRKDKKDDKK
ncbi:MAG: zinc ribbon domain-containing protein [Ignavibacteriaceae bacterium]